MSHPKHSDGTLRATRIALIVDDSDEAERESSRYLEHMPRMVAIILVAKPPTRGNLRSLARELGLVLECAANAPQAVRMADLCVVIGACPFTEEDVRVLESQGIPVERPAVKAKKKGRRPRGA